MKIIPSTLEVMNGFIKEEEDDAVGTCFEIFEELLEMRSSEFIKMVPDLIKIMLGISSNSKISVQTRIKSFEIISWIVTNETKLIISQNFIEPILQVLFLLLVEPEENPEDEQTLHKVSASLLDSIAISLPSEKIFQPIVQHSLKLTQSSKEAERKAGFTAVGVLAEGCNEQLSEILDNVIPYIIKGLEDKSQMVREIALITIHSFVEHLQPEILKFSQKLIPYCIAMLNDPSDDVKEKCVFALDAFCENIGEDFVPYLPTCMKIAYELLTKGTRRIQEIAISVISTVSNASGLNFLQYAEPVLKMMSTLMVQKNIETLSLRARATECVGNIAGAIGKTNFNFKPFILAAIDGLTLDSPDLREYTYGFFANMALVLGEEFSVYLPAIMNYLINSVNAKDSEIQKEAGESLLNNVIEKEDDDEFESDDSDIEVDGKEIIVYTSVIEEKAAAISTLGVICDVCGSKFEQYLVKSYEAVSLNLTHFHFSIRRETVGSLKLLLTKKEIPELISTFATLLVEDDDKETVARMCEAISYVCKKFGQVLSKEILTKVCNGVLDLLKRDAECNAQGTEYTGHDSVLIDSVSDLIDDLAQCYGQNFEPFYRPLFKVLVSYAVESKSEGDVLMSLGTMANVANALKGAISGYIDKMIPIMVESLKKKSFHIKRNAIYCLGVMCYNAPKEMSPYVLQILQQLHPIVKDPTKYPPVLVDNTCAALARIIISHGANIQMLDQVFMGLLELLPLREDFLENEVIFACILGLLKQNNSSAAKLMVKILNLFGKVLGTEQISKDISNSIIDLLKEMITKYKSEMEKVFKEMSQKEKDNLFLHLKN